MFLLFHHVVHLIVYIQTDRQIDIHTHTHTHTNIPNPPPHLEINIGELLLLTDIHPALTASYPHQPKPKNY